MSGAANGSEVLSLSLKDRTQGIKFARSDTRPREHTLVIVSDLYCRGLKQYEIAEMIGVSPQTVSTMVKEIRENWINAQLESFDQRVSNELAKIDHVEREAWAAWDRSIGIVRTTNSKSSQGPNEDGEIVERTEASLREVEQAGNPKFLELVDRCISRRIDLLGLKAPTRKQIHMKIEQKVEALAEQFGLDPIELMEQAGRFRQVLDE